MVADACHSYDPHPENTVYSKYGINTGSCVYISIDYCRNGNSIYRIGKNARVVGVTGNLFPVADRHDFVLYDPCNISQDYV